jgi:hypothetical protein
LKELIGWDTHPDHVSIAKNRKAELFETVGLIPKTAVGGKPRTSSESAGCFRFPDLLGHALHLILGLQACNLSLLELRRQILKLAFEETTLVGNQLSLLLRLSQLGLQLTIVFVELLKPTRQIGFAGSH